MPVRIKCPVCGYRIKAPEGAYGRRGQCPRCKLMIRIPTQEELARRQQANVAPPEASAAHADNLGDSGVAARPANRNADH